MWSGTLKLISLPFFSNCLFSDVWKNITKVKSWKRWIKRCGSWYIIIFYHIQIWNVGVQEVDCMCNVLDYKTEFFNFYIFLRNIFFCTNKNSANCIWFDFPCYRCCCRMRYVLSKKFVYLTVYIEQDSWGIFNSYWHFTGIFRFFFLLNIDFFFLFATLRR